MQNRRLTAGNGESPERSPLALGAPPRAGSDRTTAGWQAPPICNKRVVGSILLPEPVARERRLPNTFSSISFVSNGTEDAEAATNALRERYGEAGFDSAEVIVALGGDGLMLETLHRVMDRDVPVYGMNFGSVGFLMNDYQPDGLRERLAAANATNIHPLRMEVTDEGGERHEALALNEVSLFRASYQAVKVEIVVDGHTRLEELICDGVLLATPAGSTAYNLSAHGPILPIDAHLLALTPISPFRPRRWRGAVLNDQAVVTFKLSETEKRPANAVADNVEFRNVVEVTVRESRRHRVTLLFNPGTGLEERVLIEQFRY
jgi:NAD+ kinase